MPPVECGLLPGCLAGRAFLTRLLSVGAGGDGSSQPCLALRLRTARPMPVLPALAVSFVGVWGETPWPHRPGAPGRRNLCCGWPGQMRGNSTCLTPWRAAACRYSCPFHQRVPSGVLDGRGGQLSGYPVLITVAGAQIVRVSSVRLTGHDDGVRFLGRSRRRGVPAAAHALVQSARRGLAPTPDGPCRGLVGGPRP